MALQCSAQLKHLREVYLYFVQVEGKWDAETVMTVLKHLDSDSELLPPGITADLAEAVPA